MSIIIVHTWGKLGKPTMIKTKIVNSVTEEKIKFAGELITDVTFKEKNLKIKNDCNENTIFSILTGWNNSNHGIWP